MCVCVYVNSMYANVSIIVIASRCMVVHYLYLLLTYRLHNLLAACILYMYSLPLISFHYCSTFLIYVDMRETHNGRVGGWVSLSIQGQM